MMVPLPKLPATLEWSAHAHPQGGFLVAMWPRAPRERWRLWQGHVDARGRPQGVGSRWWRTPVDGSPARLTMEQALRVAWTACGGVGVRAVPGAPVNVLECGAGGVRVVAYGVHPIA